MNTLQTTPVTLTAQELDSFYKILINAWSAEYALRIPPPKPLDEDFLYTALNWQFQQTFCSVSSSFRAILNLQGNHYKENHTIIAINQEFHQAGFYAGTDVPETFLFDLNALMYGAAARFRWLGLPVQVEQLRLVNLVDSIAWIHERHIISRIGAEIYSGLVHDRVPSYIQHGFLRQRTVELFTTLEMEKEVAAI